MLQHLHDATISYICLYSEWQPCGANALRQSALQGHARPIEWICRVEWRIEHIGGATRGGRGAAVGAAIGIGAGALIGGQMERRRGNYYLYNGRCWVRFRNGEFHPVSHRYCR
ncbi:MAG: glycine zipper domain-containing protein [Pseudorhodoplanes sp.]|jgi:hypothetical protein|nr:glycine zipper domain-containing protein [Pseudorhodoplanes sp.]